MVTYPKTANPRDQAGNAEEEEEEEEEQCFVCKSCHLLEQLIVFVVEPCSVLSPEPVSSVYRAPLQVARLHFAHILIKRAAAEQV